MGSFRGLLLPFLAPGAVGGAGPGGGGGDGGLWWKLLASGFREEVLAWEVGERISDEVGATTDTLGVLEGDGVGVFSTDTLPVV